MKQKIRIADFIIEALVKANVKHIFLLPGGGNMYLIDAVAKSKKIFGVPCHHEQAAAIAAEAYSRISDNIGVALVTSGPGSTNALTGLVGAWIESIPMLIISGQAKTTDINTKLKLRQKGVQGVNILSMIKNITKFSVTLSQKSNFEDIIKKSIITAKSNRGGPVWIDIPLDIQAKIINKKTNFTNFKRKKKNNLNFNEAKFKKIVEGAKRPVFLIGHGVRLSKATSSFKKILKKYPFPSLFTWNALDILPYDHRLNLGRPGIVAQRYSNFVLQNSDLLISIGCRIDNIITAFNQKKFAPFAKKIIIDVEKNELKKFNFKIDMAINSEARLFIEKINNINIKKNSSWDEWINLCAYWKKNYCFEKENKKKESKKIDHYTLIEKLSEKIPKNTLISTGSSGLGIEIFYSIFKNKIGQRIFLTSGLGAMGYGLPSAIGSCFANKKKPMFLIEGDGSLQLNIQELSVIRNFNLPICIIILNNDGYCSIRNTQKNYFKERYLGTGPKSNLTFPNLRKIAEAYNIDYQKISTINQLNKNLAKNIKNIKSPRIIEINTIPNEVLRPKVSAIPQADGKIISMPLEDMTPLLPLKQLQKEMIISLSKESIAAKRNI